MTNTNDIIQFIKTKDYQMINNNLGKGSFGKTVLLKDQSINELFVCKKFEPYFKEDTDEFYESFKREIKIMYKLNHKNIVRIYNYYLYDDVKTGYIIMEYINGSNIKDYFSTHKEQIDINNIFLQLIEAFACLEHNGISHRDIRFSNIMITEEGIIKLIDFGLGKIHTHKTFSQDSLNKVINRNGMELIPDELRNGIYTIKTDMFCIAELYSRLIKMFNLKDFKYTNILTKMLQTTPDKRFDSFEEILNKINNKEFELTITNEDKKIYKDFSNDLLYAIVSYNQAFQMEDKISKILNDLKTIINDNCFEDEIINIGNLIEVFIKCQFTYHSNNKIKVEHVENFYNWVSNKNEHFQQIVFNNLKIKLQTIKTEIDYDDLPF